MLTTAGGHRLRLRLQFRWLANGDVDYSGAVDSTDFNLPGFAFVSQDHVFSHARAFLMNPNQPSSITSLDPIEKIDAHWDDFGSDYHDDLLTLIDG